ncbi:MAG: c-type cytochrome, partial [Pararhodobacter sp.]
YLAGEEMDGWLSPNLTPDPVNGLGGWSDQDIIEYLRTGHAGNVAQAAGPMADVVRHSTSHLTEEDLEAITAYLRVVPAVPLGMQDIPLLPPRAERTEPHHSYNQIREEMAAAMAREDLSEAEEMYLVHCAACHGVTGQGQPQAYYPSLLQNAALRRNDPLNLLQVLLHGVPAGKIYRAPAMPGFADELSAEQIATLANYTRTTFGGREDSALTAMDVMRVLEDDEEMPTPLRVLQIAAWVGIALAVVVAALLLWWVMRRRRLHRQEG